MWAPKRDMQSVGLEDDDALDRTKWKIRMIYNTSRLPGFAREEGRGEGGEGGRGGGGGREKGRGREGGE